MALVVDASVALAWALPDEINSYADAVLAAVEAEGLRVPELWAYELANGLATAYARHRITSDYEQMFLEQLSRLKISAEENDVLSVIRNGVANARSYALTAYDAAYVGLAKRENLRLASLDDRMRAAATKSGVALFDAQ